MSDNQNYAKEFGVASVPAASVFAALYVPLLIWFIRQSLRRPTQVFFTLSFFCAIRVTAFVIRAVLAGSDSAGQNLGLLVGDEILFNVGFFGLLYSAYTLVLDRESISNTPRSRGIISRLMRNRRLYRLALSVAVALGISGLSLAQSDTSKNSGTGNSLHKASVIIFLMLVILLLYQTLTLARIELKTNMGYKHAKHTFGTKYGIYILLLISVLLLVREAFSTATINNLAKLNNEHFWYPLIAVPELLTVALYTIPDLIPSRAELRQAHASTIVPPKLNDSGVVTTV